MYKVHLNRSFRPNKFYPNSLATHIVHSQVVDAGPGDRPDDGEGEADDGGEPVLAVGQAPVGLGEDALRPRVGHLAVGAAWNRLTHIAINAIGNMEP